MSYTVRGEEYICDYNRKNFTKTFYSLEAIEEWLFEMMQWSYKDHMWFPKERPSRIEINPAPRSPEVWIYLITSERGVEFSSGKMTDGQAHWSKRVQEWLKHCDERKNKPNFTFAE